MQENKIAGNIERAPQTVASCLTSGADVFKHYTLKLEL